MKSFYLLNDRAPGAALLAILLILLCVINGLSLVFTPFDSTTYFLFSPFFFNVASLLVIVGVIPVLVHLDPPLSSDAFSLTRPISRRELCMIKFLLIAVVGILLPSFASIIAPIKAGIPLASIPKLIIYIVVKNCALVFPFFLIASLTKKYTDYMIVSATTVLVGAALWYARTTIGGWPLRAFYHDPAFEVAKNLAKSDALLSLILYSTVALFSIFTILQVHSKSSIRTIGMVIVLGIMLSVGIQSYRIIKISDALKKNLELPSQEVQVRDPQIILGFLDTEDKSKATTELRVSLPLNEDSESSFPYALRFKEFSIVDDTGKEFKIPVTNFGYLPCIEGETLEKFLRAKTGKNITFPDAIRCELGEKYTLPKDAKLNGDFLPEIKGVVYGLNYSLDIDYSTLIKDRKAEATPRGAIRAIASESPFGSFAYYNGGGTELVSEIEFFPSVLSDPIGDEGEGSPLFVHWYASTKTYALVQNSSNTAKRYWTPPRNSWSESTFDVFRVNTPQLSLEPDSWSEPKISEEETKDATLYRLYPRLLGSFTASISLKKVPIKRVRISEKN